MLNEFPSTAHIKISKVTTTKIRLSLLRKMFSMLPQTVSFFDVNFWCLFKESVKRLLSNSYPEEFSRQYVEFFLIESFFRNKQLLGYKQI